MRTFSLLLLLIWSHAGFASTALLDFSNSMYSFTADFTQTVYDSDSTVLQENKGQVKLVRPGKFRWTYSEPFKQVIVADGLSLWVYDEDIAQVTVRPQAETLGSAPIGLLSGQRAIQSEFEIVHLGNRDNLEWFQLDPLVKDTDFQRVFIAVDGGGLRAMELRDSFEQATQIRFSNFQKNVEVAAEEFVFTPPEGADVVGEMGTAPEEDEVQEQPAETTEQAAQPPEQPPEQPVEQAEQAPQTEEQATQKLQDEELLGGAETVETPDFVEKPEEETAPATAEDVVQESVNGELAETPDDAGGEQETDTTETQGEVTFEVIETIEVPAE